jgi:arginyl-tRNA synthetase
LEGYQANGYEPSAETGVEQESTREQNEKITPEITAARLAMMRQVQIVIKNGLGLLGISAPDQM